MGDRVKTVTRTLTHEEIKTATLTSTEEKVLRMRRGIPLEAGDRLGTIDAVDEVDRNYIAAIEARAVQMIDERAASKKRIIDKLRKR